MMAKRTRTRGIALLPVLLILMTPPVRGQAPGLPVPGEADYERPVSWTSLVSNVGSDQKRIWLFPAKLNRRKYLLPALAVLGTAAALVAIDPHEAPALLHTTDFSGFNPVFSGNNTAWGTFAVPVGIYATGAIIKDSKLRRTALLAGEAVGDFEILGTIMKDVTQRTRPIAVGAGSYSDTWFNSSGSFLRGHGSFPSGHEGAAFAVATVVARRYGNHKWVPYAAYGLAGVVGFSRMSLGSHFSSDVFVGGVLGYTIGRFAVLRQ